MSLRAQRHMIVRTARLRSPADLAQRSRARRGRRSPSAINGRMPARADAGLEVLNGKEVSLVMLELAQLQIDDRRREMDLASLARFARQNRPESPKPTVLQRIVRSRRRIVAGAA